MCVDQRLLENVIVLLRQTLSPLTQRQAEESLKQLEVATLHFSQLLLAIADGNFPGLEVHVRMAAALLFKNFVKRHWAMETALASFTEEDRMVIKGQIVGILTKVPPGVQSQLCEAVTLIASVDFPEAWPELIQQLIQKLDAADFDNNIAIVRTLHGMFKRYRTEFRTDELYTEINFVMGQLAMPLLELYRATTALVEANAMNKTALEKLLRTQVLLNKIYYSLSSQDLPAFFEDNLGEFMELLKKQFLYKNPIIEGDNDEEAGPVEKLLTSVAKIAILYATRYEEDFIMLSQFVEAAWNVLTTITRAPRHDAVSGVCMKLLSTVARQERHKSLFSGVLQLLCDKVIIPNILVRETDLEMFEDEPIEYIRRAVEGGVVAEEKSRRDGAISLARGLMEFYEVEVTAILQSYVEEFLKIYATCPVQKWRDKNAAVSLFSAIAIRGSVSTLGVTRVNLLVNIQDFFSRHILPDLQMANVALHPLLKVDAIRFLYDFRTQLDKEQLTLTFPLIQHHLASHHPAVHTCAALAIDRILAVKKGGLPIFGPSDIAPVADSIITTIVKLLHGGGGGAGGGGGGGRKQKVERIIENEFVVKAFLRTMIVAQREVLIPIMDSPLKSISDFISIITINPNNPTFNHNIFECAAALVKSCGCTIDGMVKIETVLFPVLQSILQNDITEFIHYVFQVLAISIEVGMSANPPPPPITTTANATSIATTTPTIPPPLLSATIKSLIPPILLPGLWSSSENIPALTRFLQACMMKDPVLFIQNNYLAQVLGIFQTLVASKVYDVYAFALMGTILQAIPMGQLEGYMNGILMVILKRLQATKSPRLSLNFLLFLCIFLVSLGIPQPGSYLIRLFDGLQPKLLAIILTGLLLPQASKIRDRHDRRLVMIGLTKLATECPELLCGDLDYGNLFVNLISTLVIMSSSAPLSGSSGGNPNPNVNDNLDGDFEKDQGLTTMEDEEPSGSFWQLKVAPPPPRCPLVEHVPNVKSLFVNSIVSLSRSQPAGRIASILTVLDATCQSLLSSLLHQANASL